MVLRAKISHPLIIKPSAASFVVVNAYGFRVFALIAIGANRSPLSVRIVGTAIVLIFLPLLESDEFIADLCERHFRSETFVTFGHRPCLSSFVYLVSKFGAR